MTSKRRELVGVVLAEGIASEKEQDVINSIPREYKVRLLNGRFMTGDSSERPNTDFILNLSGKKEVDEWYKDILMDNPLDSTEKQEPVDKAEVEKQEGEEQFQKELKAEQDAAKKAAPKKATKAK